jgi:NUC130/3NT domain
VAPCYPHEVQGFAAEVGGLLEEQATALDSSTRLALVGRHGTAQGAASDAQLGKRKRAAQQGPAQQHLPAAQMLQ